MRKTSRSIAALLIALCCLCCGPGACLAEEKIILPGCAHHDHDDACGGLQNLCRYVCQRCVGEIQQMINDLPAADQEIAETDQAGVIAQMEAIDDRKYLISDDARALIDFMMYELTALRLAPPYPSMANSLAYLAIQKTCIGDVPQNAPAPVVSAASGHRSAGLYPYGGMEAEDAIMPKPNGPGAAACIMQGAYTLSESGYEVDGYTCETRLLVNGREAQKAKGYPAAWNVTFAGGKGYHIEFINCYTPVASRPGGEAAAKQMPDTGDESRLLPYLMIAVGCAMGALLVHSGKRRASHL